MEGQNYQNTVTTNEIDINTPEGIEEVKQIFDAHPISTRNSTGCVVAPKRSGIYIGAETRREVL
jgi:hypothetical protein